MTITPSTTIIESPEANLGPKQNDFTSTTTVLRRSSQKSTEEFYSNSKQMNVTNGRMTVRFSDAPTSIIPSWTMTNNESRSLSSSSSNSGSSGYNSDNANHSSEDNSQESMCSSDSSETVVCGPETKNDSKAYSTFNGSYLTSGKSSIVIPRRSSSLLASSTSAPRRVSLSVTDL